MQAFFSASVEAYAFKCCTCARMPSCGVSKEFPFMPFAVTPMPQKLFCESVTVEPEKVKFPVSRQDCAKAISPRTPSAFPSERYSETISRTDCVTFGFFAFRYVFICSAVATAFPMIFVYPSVPEDALPIAALTALRNPSIVYPIPSCVHRCSGSPWLLAMPRLWPSLWEITTPSANGFRLYFLQSMANSSTAAS